MPPEWEPIRGFVPHVAKPPACTRRTPRRHFPGLAPCCKLGAGLLGIRVMGKVLISLYFLAHSLSDSENDLGSTETSSTDSTEDPGLTHLTDFMSTSFPPLQIAGAQQVNDSLPAKQVMLDQEIKNLFQEIILVRKMIALWLKY